MTIYTQGDPLEDTRLEKRWGRPRAILDNGGDTVRLNSFRGIELDCYAYGTASC